MLLNRLQLNQFRNLKAVDWQPHARTNLLLGANAQGKTNVVEGIYLLATTKSLRGASDPEMVAHGQSQARLAATLRREAAGSLRELEILLAREDKRGLKLNGKPVRKSSQLFGQLNVVLFTPADLGLVQAGPAARRTWLDLLLSQAHPAYLEHAQAFQQALKQRNAALRALAEGRGTRALVEAFDEGLAASGAELLGWRLRAVRTLEPLAAKAQDQVSGGGEVLSLALRSSVLDLPREAALPSVEELRQRYLARLVETAREESARGITVAGPHRDDLELALDGKPARAFASQGQQRTTALALKLAEVEYLRQALGEHPVLLLDDVLSELDGRRQAALLALLDERVQTFLTSTHAEALPFAPGQVLQVADGRLLLQAD
jgi:DNA replication and repair protein RecF